MKFDLSTLGEPSTYAMAVRLPTPAVTKESGARMHQRVINHPRPLALLLAASLAGGCTSKEIYNWSQGWRQNECNKIGDTERRERCLKEEANRPYETYDAASAAKP